MHYYCCLRQINFSSSSFFCCFLVSWPSTPSARAPRLSPSTRRRSRLFWSSNDTNNNRLFSEPPTSYTGKLLYLRTINLLITSVMCWCCPLSVVAVLGGSHGAWKWTLVLKKKRKNLIFVSCDPEKPNHPSNISDALSQAGIREYEKSQFCPLVLKGVGMLSKWLAPVDIIYCYFPKSIGTNVAV